MKKIILYIAASIDGRIAEPDGGIEWLSEFPITNEMNYGYKEFMASIDTIIMGGRSWRELSNMDAMGAYTDKTVYVVSRHNWGDNENVNFITESVIEQIANLRNEPGKDIWLFGGGELVSMLLAADLVDEMQIAYIPVILGEGIPLFPKQPKESKWKLIENRNYSSGIMMVEYQKKKWTSSIKKIDNETEDLNSSPK
ncbi:MAG: dihydrofolate reductase family protein [Prevotella sp.]|jgi:dihydrofolate reductase|nr:dihydrofolate reductase family protein [Prevotella sp.]